MNGVNKNGKRSLVGKEMKNQLKKKLKRRKKVKNKIFLFLLVGVFLISFTSAETIFAGECSQVNLSSLGNLDNVVYTSIGNSSNLEGLTINLNGTIANICTVPNFKPDNFTLVFTNRLTKEVVKTVRIGGGGGTRTITKYINTTEYKNNTIINDSEVKRLTNELQKVKDKLQESNTEPKKNNLFSGISLLFVIILIIFLFLVISLAFHKLKKKYSKNLENIEMKGGSEKYE